ncbi:hypothetical protein [Enterobacter cloacae]|uniref:DUF1983 domain-containing protein n=1 Tax=Enterobacter cloacae TaxID=550 RepID=A0A144IQJ6_ENTCL|nr:hypothetical protein [Enterobacter cloacae]CZV21519.1 Uncharacterised protein [Enterobacter cloacae]SAF61781.1 Uncharacterised protein [Enterobacter cloacae]
MKHLPLKAVMTGLEIIETDEGYELHSPAGEAKYDACGTRREVNGIPEYFPSSISMKKRELAATGDNKNYRSGFEIAIDAGDAAKAIDEIDEHICNSDAFKKLTNGWFFEKDGTLIINNGQVFIRDEKSAVTVRVGKFGIHSGVDTNLDDIIKNSLASHAALQQIRKDIATVVEDEITKNLKPGGTIWDCLRRGI